MATATILVNNIHLLRLKAWFWPWAGLSWSPGSLCPGQSYIETHWADSYPLSSTVKEMCLCCWNHRHGANLSGRLMRKKPGFSPLGEAQNHLKVCSAWGACTDMLRAGTGYLIFWENTAARPQLLPKARLHLCPLLKYYSFHPYFFSPQTPNFDFLWYL